MRGLHYISRLLSTRLTGTYLPRIVISCNASCSLLLSLETVGVDSQKLPLHRLIFFWDI